MSGCTQVCNQGRDCTCSNKPNDCAAEAGNIWFAEPEPVEPLSGREMMLVWGLVLVFGLSSLVLVLGGIGYAWARYIA